MEFKRNLDVELGARNILKMKDEEILRTDIKTLTEKVLAEVDKLQAESLADLFNNREHHLNGMSRSEIGQVKSVYQESPQKLRLPIDPPSPEEVKNMQYLTQKFDFKALIKKKDGMLEFVDHVDLVNKEAKLLQDAVRREQDILIVSSDVLDEEDVENIKNNINVSKRQIELIRSYMEKIYNDLSDFIAQRKSTETQLLNSKGANTCLVAEKMKEKTFRLKSIATVIKTYIDCLDF